MRQQRSYTDEDKLQVRALLLDGHSQHAIERQLNIPQQTISRWRDDWVELGTEISEQLANAELRLAQRFDRIVERKLDAIEAGEEQISMLCSPIFWRGGLSPVARCNSHAALRGAGWRGEAMREFGDLAPGVDLT